MAITTPEKTTAVTADGSAAHVVAPARGRRSWLIVMVSALLIVLAAEAGARALAPRLPAIDHWNQREAAIEYDQMRALSASGGVDVAWVGSSVAQFAFEPADFESADGRRAYNAALPGSGMASVTQWTNDFVIPLLKPKMVVIGLTSRDLNDNGPVQREHFDKYFSSEGRRRALGIGTAMERLERAIDQRSALVRLRQHLRRPASVAKQLRGQSALVRPVDIGPLGEARFPEGDYPYSDNAQRRAWEREALQDFDMTNSIANLRTLISTLQSGGIEVVVVDMPVLEDVYAPFHPNGRIDYAAYRAALGGLGVRVVRIEGARFENDSHFVDSIHLNRAGARRFSRTLATHLGAR